MSSSVDGELLLLSTSLLLLSNRVDGLTGRVRLVPTRLSPPCSPGMTPIVLLSLTDGCVEGAALRLLCNVDLDAGV